MAFPRPWRREGPDSGPSRARMFRLLVSFIVLGAAVAPRPACAQAEVNVALGMPVSASGPTWSGQVPGNLTDGSLSNQTHPQASSGTLGFFYEIDLEREVSIGRLEIVNRAGCCPERLTRYRVDVLADGGGSPGALRWSALVRADGSHSGDGGRDTITADLDPGGDFAGRFIRVVNESDAAYNPQMAELEVYEAPRPRIRRFDVDAGNITAGGDPELPGEAVLSWDIGNATSAVIEPGIGEVAVPVGSVVVQPDETTVFTLRAANATGSASATVTVGVDEPVLDPVITEFMASNRSTLEDGDGGRPDWIEMHNPNAFSLNVAGYHLTDSADDPARWAFPAFTIPAGGHAVVFADDPGESEGSGPPRTGFRLDAAGEFLALVARDGVTVLQRFPAADSGEDRFPPQMPDISFGIGVEGDIGFLERPTPGAANTGTVAGFVADTKFSVDRGVFDAPISVAIATATEGAGIRFTTDGSRPSETRGTLYTGPIAIDRTTVLRAMAFKDGLVPTNVDTQTYVFPEDVAASPVMNPSITGHPTWGPMVREGLRDLPSMSLVLDAAVNGTSEVGASLEWFDPATGANVRVPCGVKHFGGAFTNFAKKNFRLYFRARHGATKLDARLFDGHERGLAPATSFDQLELRGGSHDMEARGFYMSNRFTDDTMLDMGNVNPHGRFVHLYLDGVYWGHFHLRERWGASMIASYLGGEDTDYESINGNWNVGGWAEPGSPYDGDGSAWARIKSLRDDFEAVRPFLDVANYIDYMILFLFGDCEDEYRCTGPVEAGSGFLWFLNDADGFLRTSAGDRTGRDTPGRRNGDGPGSIFSMLVAEGHPDFRMLLADRIQRHLVRPGGALTPERNEARLAGRVREIERAFTAESARWGYRSPTSWASAARNIEENWFPTRTATVVTQFRRAGFYPALAAPVIGPPHGGSVAPGTAIAVDAPRGTLLVTTDGSDPRLPGGAVAPSARPVTGGTESVVIVPAGADAWRYLDTGADLGTSEIAEGHPAFGADNWKHPGFDDAAWRTGRPVFGYGEDDIVTEIRFGPREDNLENDPGNRFLTSYFRRSFEVPDAAAVVGVRLRIRRDDGAVVYLNGVEVARSGFPDGATVAFDTPSAVAADDGSGFHEFTLDPALLASGPNLVAAEVHQSSSGSSDLRFDLELVVDRLPVDDGPIVASGNTWVRARALDGTEWSALNEAFFSTGDPLPEGAVTLSEIHFHPTGSGDTEFLELANLSDEAVNLRGAAFSDGIEFTFPDNRDTILAPGQRLVLVHDLFAFRKLHGLDVPVAGIFRGRLANDGETVTLSAPDGTPRASVSYDDRAPWPTAADGKGPSLVFVGSDPANPLDWMAGSDPDGSPARAEGAAFTGDPFADADGDGSGALLEWVLGTSDDDPSSRPAPSLEIATAEDGAPILLLRLDRRPAEGAVLRIEWSHDLDTWLPADERIALERRERIEEASGQPLERLWFRVDPAALPGEPPSANRSRFLRARVTVR